MPKCPQCGVEQDHLEESCRECGYQINGFETANAESHSATNEERGKEPITSDKGETQSPGQDDKRKKWLEQQKALQDELSGLKTVLKDEITKKEIPVDLPFPGPYPRYYTAQADFDITGRNYHPVQIDVNGIRTPEPIKQAEQTEDAPPATASQDGDQQVKKIEPRKTSIKPGDVIQVDTILEDDEDINLRSKNSQIAGAIDRILTHEKSQKTKVMKMKLSTPSLKTPPGKMKPADDLVRSLELSLRKAPQDFNKKPIEILLTKARQKIAEKDLNEALNLAVHAKKALKRFQEFYKTSKAELRELETAAPSITDPDNAMFREYQRILSLMGEGQYHKVAQKISEIKNRLNLDVKKETVTIGDTQKTPVETEQLSPTSEGDSALEKAIDPEPGPTTVAHTSEGTGQIEDIPKQESPDNPEYSQGAQQIVMKEQRKMPKWMRKRSKRKKMKQR